MRVAGSCRVFTLIKSRTDLAAGGCWHDAARLRRRREERRYARTQQRQCCAAAGAGSGAGAEEPPRAQQHGSARDSAWQRSQEWARLLLTLPLELSAIGAKTEAHWLRRRNRSSWWRSNARFPKARRTCHVRALGSALHVKPVAGRKAVNLETSCILADCEGVSGAVNTVGWHIATFLSAHRSVWLAEATAG